MGFSLTKQWNKVIQSFFTKTALIHLSEWLTHCFVLCALCCSATKAHLWNCDRFHVYRTGHTAWFIWNLRSMTTMLSSSKSYQIDWMFKSFYAEKFSNGATITATIEEYYDVPWIFPQRVPIILWSLGTIITIIEFSCALAEVFYLTRYTFI